MTFKASLNGGAVDGRDHVDFGSLYADKPAPPPVNMLAQQQAAEHAQRGRELRAVLYDQDATDDAKVDALVQMKRLGIEWPNDHRVDDAEGRVAAYEANAAKAAARLAKPSQPVAKLPGIAVPNAKLALQAEWAKVLQAVATSDTEEARRLAAVELLDALPSMVRFC